MMLRSFIVAVFAIVVLGWSPPVRAQTANYHLERLGIQARVFSESLRSDSAVPASVAPGQTVNDRLQESVENSVWARQMVSDDLKKIIDASQRLVQSDLGDADSQELLSAKNSLEALARRLRVSSSALTLTPGSQTDLNFLMLELEESSRVLDAQRTQLLAQQQHRRSRPAWGVNLGLGFGYGSSWGAPLGWGTYYPYGNISGPGPFYGYPYGTGTYRYPRRGYWR